MIPGSTKLHLTTVDAPFWQALGLTLHSGAPHAD